MGKIKVTCGYIWDGNCVNNLKRHRCSRDVKIEQDDYDKWSITKTAHKHIISLCKSHKCNCRAKTR